MSTALARHFRTKRAHGWPPVLAWGALLLAGACAHGKHAQDPRNLLSTDQVLAVAQELYPLVGQCLPDEVHEVELKLVLSGAEGLIRSYKVKSTYEHIQLSKQTLACLRQVIVGHQTPKFPGEEMAVTFPFRADAENWAVPFQAQ